MQLRREGGQGIINCTKRIIELKLVMYRTRVHQISAVVTSFVSDLEIARKKKKGKIRGKNEKKSCVKKI